MGDRQTMVISVMAQDRPGIVAEVTEGISSLGGNLADLRESVLCGWFTMILVTDFPARVTPKQVNKTLTDATAAQISVALHEGPLEETGTMENTYVLTVAGKNRVGLVAQVSRFCCDRGVNIIDLASHVESDQYIMMLQLDLSNVRSIETFQKELYDLGEKSGLSLVLQHNDIFRATNEI